MHQSTIASQLYSSTLPLHGEVEKAKGYHNRCCDLHNLIESTARPIAETKRIACHLKLMKSLAVPSDRNRHNHRRTRQIEELSRSGSPQGPERHLLSSDDMLLQIAGGFPLQIDANSAQDEEISCNRDEVEAIEIIAHRG